MKKISLVDVDSKIPNIALMKIATYYKSKNYEVDIIKLNISYYPNMKPKKIFFIDNSKYDKTFVSAIFENTINYVEFSKNENLYKGGTGVDFNIKLPKYIEKLNADHSIYPENKDKTYDFITRGCIRNCYFCVVPRKEGKLHQVKRVKQIIEEARTRNHKELILMDNNILGFENHDEILLELVKSKMKVDFNQGLDIRLLNSKNQKLLIELKYVGAYHFAFDDINYKKILEKKKKLIKKFGEWRIKLYIYVHPNMSLSETVERIRYCKENKYHPYIMRDITCWDSKYNEFYIDLASYCNQPKIFKIMSFENFLNKRHTKKIRIKRSLELWMNYKESI